MYAVVMLVCGIEAYTPFVVNGCALVNGRVPQVSLNQCLDNKALIYEDVSNKLPPGARIVDGKCVLLGEKTTY